MLEIFSGIAPYYGIIIFIFTAELSKQVRVLARAPTASDHKRSQTFTAQKVIQQPFKTALRAHLERFTSNL